MSTQTDTVRGNTSIDIKRFDKLEVTFSNKDVLRLKLAKGTHIHGFLPGDVLELSYGEHHYGDYADLETKVDQTKYYFTNCATQFFPTTALKEAMAAFFERLNSARPCKESQIFPSYPLEQCLTKDPNELKLMEQN